MPSGTGLTRFAEKFPERFFDVGIAEEHAIGIVPVGIMTFVGEHGTDYGYLCAGVLVSVIPVMVVYLIFQRYLIDGMTSGAVKG